MLRDGLGEFALPGAAGPEATVDRESASAYRVTTAAADEPYLLVLGQNIGPGWRATMDGVALGPPVVVDGYAMGWWVRDLDPHEFHIEYAPQRVSDVALAASGGAVLLSTGLLLAPGRGSGVPARPAPAPAVVPANVGSGPRRRRERAGWLLFVVGCWVFAGLPGAAVAGVVAGWSILGRPAPRTLLRLSAVTMALAPLAWIVGNLGRWGEPSPQLVLGNPAPSVLVVASLVLLVVGSWRDERADGAGPGRPGTTPTAVE